MIETLEVLDFLSTNSPIIDVRSPAEYAHGHIPNAVNIPIFDNEQRAVIGTLYKQVGKEQAVEKGLAIVGPKMEAFVAESKRIAIDKKVHVHCWRGGMRSTSFAWLLQTASLHPSLLKEGYKNYRKYVLAYLQNLNLKIVVLGGFTGSGKTHILHQLKEMGQQVIDLEGLACHKGSVFGALGQSEQPTNEQFENNLAYELNMLNHALPIWVEAESRLIGNICIHVGFWNNMKKGFRINIVMDIAHRANRLAEEYGKMPVEDLIVCIQKIESRLGIQHTTQAIKALKNGEVHQCALICLKYYDKYYGENIKDWQTVQLSQFEIQDPTNIEFTTLINQSNTLYGVS